MSRVSRRLSILSAVVLLAVVTRPVAAQAVPHRTARCAAAVCDEEVILLAAVDTVLKDLVHRGFTDVRPPRILRTLHLSPFRHSGALSPEVDFFQPFDLSTFRRAWPGTAIVDSTEVVSADGATLRPGGVLLVLAPVTWLGPDAARVRLAEYPRRIDYGAERFIFLEYREGSWRVVRVENGWQH